MRPADGYLVAVRLSDARSDDVRADWQCSRGNLVGARDIGDRVGDREERAVRVPDAVGVRHREYLSKPLAVGVDGGEQDVRVRVPEVVIPPPSAADDILAIALHVVYESGARLNIVLVLGRRLAKIVKRLVVGKDTGLAGSVQDDEVRVERLIDRK